MKKLLLSLSLFGALFMATADTVQSYNGTGYYANINTGIATMQDLPTGSWTGNLNIGYNFDNNWAVEVGYGLFANQQYGDQVTTTTNIFDVAAKGTVPLYGALSGYGRLGLGLGINGWSGTIQDSSSCAVCQSNNENTYMLGLASLGLSYAFNNNIDLRIEDTMYVPFATTFAGSTINAVTIGAQYNF